MTIIALALSLFAANTAFGQEAPEARTTEVEDGSIVIMADGREVYTPAAAERHIAMAEAESKAKIANDKLLARTEAERIRLTETITTSDGTVRTLSPARVQAEVAQIEAETPTKAYTETEVTDTTHTVGGGNTLFSTQMDDCIAIATSQARKAKMEVIADAIAECRRIAVEQTRADTEQMLARAVLEGKPVQAIAINNPNGGGVSTTELPAEGTGSVASTEVTRPSPSTPRPRDARSPALATRSPSCSRRSRTTPSPGDPRPRPAPRPPRPRRRIGRPRRRSRPSSTARRDLVGAWTGPLGTCPGAPTPFP